jgi:hypothetical protein
MIYNVELVMYQNGKIRPVTVPDPLDTINPMGRLGLIFQYGQNDVQPIKGCCSVSMGDVIEMDGKHWLILPVGFKELNAEEYSAWLDSSVQVRLMKLLK